MNAVSLFYVLYSPSRKKYVNEDGEFCTYAEAEKHAGPYFTPSFDDVKWVGPCKEGEEP